MKTVFVIGSLIASIVGLLGLFVLMFAPAVRHWAREYLTAPLTWLLIYLIIFFIFALIGTILSFFKKKEEKFFFRIYSFWTLFISGCGICIISVIMVINHILTDF
ncbi:ABC-type transport system involved in multi-copper enzyme maturation permease subunit [Pullulanibacillus pueri]|uniref:Uncharacterized protein n=1 Tax=Pullulanibacillus pueri TaxID=1437324 RepID=A0A8J2ZX22_9BACL|nr:hypothetical protein [Pullulanibacillus pueri]MBM7680680.1 ABC-type transport system involved in multi-copper enzyme maturation permease subunit [Pullulanibacillus pueri]GGH83763.1 hypothetical protein GCM10007096_25270 [Pullulanibacillus pueri]